jgi:hypothetical protein
MTNNNDEGTEDMKIDSDLPIPDTITLLDGNIQMISLDSEIRPNDEPNSKILIFLKYYDPMNDTLRMIGSDIYSKSDIIWNLLPLFAQKAGLLNAANCELFIEIPCLFPNDSILCNSIDNG